MLPLNFRCYFNLFLHTTATANGQTQPQDTVTCTDIIYGTHNAKQIRYLLRLALLWHWDTKSSESGWTSLVRWNSSYRKAVQEAISGEGNKHGWDYSFSPCHPSFLPCHLPSPLPSRHSPKSGCTFEEQQSLLELLWPCRRFVAQEASSQELHCS